MLKDAALLQLRLAVGGARRGADAQGRDAVQRAVARDAAGVRGRRLVRARAGGEPWAGYRQFCMLFLYPLMLESYRGVRVPAVAAREHRRHLADRFPRAAHAPRHVPARGAEARRPARESRGAVCESRRRGPQRPERGRVRSTARRSERLSDDEARDSAAAARLGDRVDRLSGDVQLRRRRGGAEGRVRQARRREPAPGPRLGPRLQRRPLLAHRRLRRRLRPGDRLGSPRRRRPLRALRADGNRTILPLVVDLVEPVARARVGERGAQDARSSAARRSSSSRSRSSITSRSRATSRSARSSRWLRGLDCEVVVEFPDRERPDGPAPARREARRRPSGLRARDLRGAARCELPNRRVARAARPARGRSTTRFRHEPRPSPVPRSVPAPHRGLGLRRQPARLLADRRQPRPSDRARRDAGRPLRSSPYSSPSCRRRSSPGTHGSRGASRSGSGTCSTSSASARSSRPLAARLVRHLDATLVLSVALVVGCRRRGRRPLCPCHDRLVCSSGTRSCSRSSASSGSSTASPTWPRTLRPPVVHVKSPTPIVFIELDEMAGSALMTRDGQARRGPVPELRATGQ